MRIIYTIILSLSILACYNDDDYFKMRDPRLDPYIEFFPKEGAQANGVDTLLVKLKFPVDPQFDSISAKFEINEGLFLENNKQEYNTSRWYRDIDGLLTISSRIRSTTNRSQNFLSIEISTLPKVGEGFWFLNAYPERIITDENKFSVKKGLGDEIQLIANVLSTRGYASKGTEVEFKVGNQSSKNSKWFRNLTKTDEKGQATVYFSPGSLTQTGSVDYEVIAADKNGKPVIGKGVFDVVD